MTATATETKAKAIVTTKLMSDGTAVIKPTKPTLAKLQAASDVCGALKSVTQLTDLSKAAQDALNALIDECSE